jgi:hypothetical protein
VDRDRAVAQVERHGGADGGPAALLSLFLKNFKRTPPAASCGVLS